MSKEQNKDRNLFYRLYSLFFSSGHSANTSDTYNDNNVKSIDNFTGSDGGSAGGSF